MRLSVMEDLSDHAPKNVKLLQTQITFLCETQQETFWRIIVYFSDWGIQTKKNLIKKRYKKWYMQLFHCKKTTTKKQAKNVFQLYASHGVELMNRADLYLEAQYAKGVQFGSCNSVLHMTMCCKQLCQWFLCKVTEEIENCLYGSAFLHGMTVYLSKLNKRSQRRLTGLCTSLLKAFSLI